MVFSDIDAFKAFSNYSKITKSKQYFSPTEAFRKDGILRSFLILSFCLR